MSNYDFEITEGLIDAIMKKSYKNLDKTGIEKVYKYLFARESSVYHLFKDEKDLNKKFELAIELDGLKRKSTEMFRIFNNSECEGMNGVLITNQDTYTISNGMVPGYGDRISDIIESISGTGEVPDYIERLKNGEEVSITTKCRFVKDKENSIEKINSFNEIKEYEIWSEGYKTEEDSGTAIILGVRIASTFVGACLSLFSERQDLNRYFDKKSMTYFGCKLFDNEIDARRNFG